MSKFPKGIWAILASLIILILAILGVIIIDNGSDVLPQDNVLGVQNNQTLKVRVNDTYSPIEEFELTVTTEDTLERVLQKLSSENLNFTVNYTEYDFGKMISGINGYNSLNNEFWNIKLNDADAQVGVSDLKVKPGDLVELTIVKF